MATDRLPSRGNPTTNAATTAITAAMARMTSSTAIACQALQVVPSVLYHGRNRATSITTPPTAATQSPLLRRRGSTARRLTDCGAAFSGLELGRAHRVDEQHRDRHRSHAAGHRCDRGRLLGDRVEVDVANEALVGPVGAHVDDDRAL